MNQHSHSAPAENNDVFSMATEPHSAWEAFTWLLNDPKRIEKINIKYIYFYKIIFAYTFFCLLWVLLQEGVALFHAGIHFILVKILSIILVPFFINALLHKCKKSTRLNIFLAIITFFTITPFNPIVLPAGNIPYTLMFFGIYCCFIILLHLLKTKNSNIIYTFFNINFFNTLSIPVLITLNIIISLYFYIFFNDAKNENYIYIIFSTIYNLSLNIINLITFYLIINTIDFIKFQFIPVRLNNNQYIHNNNTILLFASNAKLLTQASENPELAIKFGNFLLLNRPLAQEFAFSVLHTAYASMLQVPPVDNSDNIKTIASQIPSPDANWLQILNNFIISIQDYEAARQYQQLFGFSINWSYFFQYKTMKPHDNINNSIYRNA